MKKRRCSTGFIDSCRVCAAEIFRKGQNRPRICLHCEKLKFAPIVDRCKDCSETIVRNNVRKARICQKCKKYRERGGGPIIQTSTGGPVARMGVLVGANNQPTANNPIKGPSLMFTAKNRLDYVLQWQNMAEMLQMAGKPAPPLNDESLIYKGNLLPKLSDIPKLRTSIFPAPEDLVEFLVRSPSYLPQVITSAVPLDTQPSQETVASEEELNILIPHINPFAAAADPGGTPVYPPCSQQSFLEDTATGPDDQNTPPSTPDIIMNDEELPLAEAALGITPRGSPEPPASKLLTWFANVLVSE